MQLDPAEMAGIVRRLRRAQGQIGGVIAMLEQGRECQDVVHQLSAASKALDKAGYAIVSTGMKQCLADPQAARGSDMAAMEKLFLTLS